MNVPTTLRRLVHAAFALAAVILVQFSSKASAAPLDKNDPGVRAAMALQADVTGGLMSSPAVLGTAVGVDDTSAHATLVVYVDRNHAAVAAVIRSLPAQMRGVAVRVEATDKFRAFKGPPGGGGPGVSHTSKQTAPIQLGTSGGWANDLANGYCCGGTLGSLIRDGKGNLYILSNYHVFESDTTPGGNGTIAATGQNIIQPGLIDVNCTLANAQAVATLVSVQSLPYSNVDCSVAQIISGKVSADGAILEIGTLSANTAPAGLGQPVKKSGRTTGLTRSKISGLNATIRVSYEDECAGNTAFTQTFTGQIVISNQGSKFLDSGDSGSLMVEDVATKPRAVGLLFAGSSTSAIANPIDEVLAFLETKLAAPVTMVGN
jgi:hypothetical protein